MLECVPCGVGAAVRRAATKEAVLEATRVGAARMEVKRRKGAPVGVKGEATAGEGKTEPRSGMKLRAAAGVLGGGSAGVGSGARSGGGVARGQATRVADEERGKSGDRGRVTRGHRASGSRGRRRRLRNWKAVVRHAVRSRTLKATRKRAAGTGSLSSGR